MSSEPVVSWNARRAAVVVVVCTALASVAACGRPSGVTEAPAPVSTTQSPSPSPSPTPPAATDEQLKLWVEAAQLTPEIVGDGVRVRDQSSVSLHVLRPCNKDLASDWYLYYGHYSTWGGKNIPYVEHGVYGLRSPGLEMVSAIRNNARSCRTYDMDTAEITVLGDYDLPKPKGIEAFYASASRARATVVRPPTSALRFSAGATSRCRCACSVRMSRPPWSRRRACFKRQCR